MRRLNDDNDDSNNGVVVDGNDNDDNDDDKTTSTTSVMIVETFSRGKSMYYWAPKIYIFASGLRFSNEKTGKKNI